MHDYVNKIDGRVIGLSGDQATIDEIATRYGIFYEKGTPDQSGKYEVKHTATLSLIDPKGYLKVIYPYEAKPEGITSDVRYILRN
jgi:protein SCO1